MTGGRDSGCGGYPPLADFPGRADSRNAIANREIEGAESQVSTSDRGLDFERERKIDRCQAADFSLYFRDLSLYHPGIATLSATLGH